MSSVGRRTELGRTILVLGIGGAVAGASTYGFFLGLGYFSSIWGGVQCIVPEVYGQGCIPRLRTLGGVAVWAWLISGLGGYWVLLQLDSLGIPRVLPLVRDRIARSARRRRQLFALLDTPVTPSLRRPVGGPTTRATSARGLWVPPPTRPR